MFRRAISRFTVIGEKVLPLGVITPLSFMRTLARKLWVIFGDGGVLPCLGLILACRRVMEDL